MTRRAPAATPSATPAFEPADVQRAIGAPQCGKCKRAFLPIDSHTQLCLCDGRIVVNVDTPHQTPAAPSSSPAHELDVLLARMTKGRTKYPTGCTVLSLLDEAGEVAHAVNKRESHERVRDELLDVAAVAMRLYAGEIDTAWQPAAPFTSPATKPAMTPEQGWAFLQNPPSPYGPASASASTGKWPAEVARAARFVLGIDIEKCLGAHQQCVVDLAGFARLVSASAPQCECSEAVDGDPPCPVHPRETEAIDVGCPVCLAPAGRVCFPTAHDAREERAGLSSCSVRCDCTDSAMCFACLSDKGHDRAIAEWSAAKVKP